MGSTEEWCADKLAKLLNEELRISTLNEIKEHLSSATQTEATTTANLLDLPLVFDCLNHSDSTQIDLACEVLSLCMKNLNLGESTNRYCAHLERALKHPHVEVKTMALKELNRYTKNEEAIKDLSRRSSLFHTIIQCIADNELSVAKEAQNILVSIGQTDFGIKQFINPETTEVIQEVMATSEIVRLRIYELLVKISAISIDSLNGFKSIGLLQKIIAELNSNDVLLKINVIEILITLAVTKHGYEYLDGNDVMKKLFKYLSPDADPLDTQICEPSILKFFGNICHWKPSEMISKYPVVINKLFLNLETDDFTILSISLETFAHIAERNDGKIALASLGDKMEKAIKSISGRLSSLPTEIKVRAMGCLESLFYTDSNENRITTLIRKWFYLVDTDPMEVFLKYCRNPFTELRLAGFDVIKSISTQDWGQECIKTTPGLVEFLLDRSAESIKECKEVKYEIVKNLSHSMIFDNLMQKRLQAFVKEGPFYIQGVMEVAIEGND